MIDKTWFSVFLIRFILATTGVPLENDKLRYLNHYTLVFIFNSVSIMSQTIFVSYAEDMNLVWIAVNNLVHNMNYFATWIILYLNRNSLLKILSVFQINIYQYPEHMLKFKPPENTGALVSFMLFVASYSSLIVILMAPLVFQIINKLPPSVNGLVFPCWFPWSIDSHLKYGLTYMLQIFCGFASCWFMPGNIVFVMHFVFIIQEQCQIMNDVLENLKNHHVRLNQPHGPQMTGNVQFKRDLIECMKHHSALIK